MNTKLKFYLSRDFMWGDNIAVRIGARINESNSLAVAEEVKFRVRERAEEGAEIIPCMYWTRDDAQALMDELWNVGIRPTEGTGSAGSLVATERHLNDMRALVFKTGAPK